MRTRLMHGKRYRGSIYFIRKSCTTTWSNKRQAGCMNCHSGMQSFLRSAERTVQRAESSGTIRKGHKVYPNDHVLAEAVQKYKKCCGNTIDCDPQKMRNQDKGLPIGSPVSLCRPSYERPVIETGKGEKTWMLTQALQRYMTCYE